jgi:ubiquinone/menaquinone biosynthesis C-methylase UbiE
MIPRVLEPEAMDTADEAREYDAMDHSEVNSRFAADFFQAHGPWRGGRALDVGAGTARIPIEMCKRNPSMRILGIDLADQMLAVGRQNVEAAGMTDRIELARLDAKALPFSEGEFEAVVSNSIVHHVPVPTLVLTEMARVVAVGGTLFVHDLVRPDSEEELRRLVAVHAGSATSAAQSLFADSLRAALALEDVRSIVRGLGLPETDVALTSDRHWTWICKKQ